MGSADSDPVHRPYLGEAAADRVAGRRRQLVDAARSHLATDGGWERLTITQLCSDAGLNKRYFYESFEHLDAVAGAVVDDLVDQLSAIAVREATDGIEAGLETADLAAQVLGSVVEWLVADDQRATVLFATATGHPAARGYRRRAMDALARTLSAFSLDYHGAAEPPAIVGTGAALLIGGSAEAVLQWLERDRPTGLDELVDDLARFWVAIGDAAVEQVLGSMSSDRDPGKAQDRATRS